MKSRSFLFSVLFLTGTILTGCGGGASDNGQTAQATDTLPAIPHVVLNNGMEMPQLGVGTFTLKETAAECVKHAIGLGYRLVDAAQGYDNEAEVWQGIEESGIDRNEVFITSKIAPDAMRSGKVRESLDRTIEAFGGTYRSDADSLAGSRKGRGDMENHGGVCRCREDPRHRSK